jgi:hypothetical protein
VSRFSPPLVADAACAFAAAGMHWIGECWPFWVGFCAFRAQIEGLADWIAILRALPDSVVEVNGRGKSDEHSV